jgi:hypothetical protein
VQALISTSNILARIGVQSSSEKRLQSPETVFVRDVGDDATSPYSQQTSKDAGAFPPLKRFLLVLSVLFLVPVHLRAWTSGELLIWTDADRWHGLAPIAKKNRERFWNQGQY